MAMHHTQDFPKQDTEVRYWAVTVSNDYIIEIGYELNVDPIELMITGFQYEKW